MTRRSQPRALVIFKISYWGTVIGLAIAVVFYAPYELQVLLVYPEGIIVFGFYSIAAGAIYRLLLLFAWHALGGDAVMDDIKDSEGRIELDLNERRH